MRAALRLFERPPVALRPLGSGLLGLAALTAVAVEPATASSVPAGTTFVQCFAAGNNSFDAAECTQGGSVGVPPSAFASATLSPFPVVSAEVTAPSISVLGAGADANAHYSFQVTGGNVGDVVPVLVDYRLGASATPDSTAVAKFIIYTTAMGAAFPHFEELVCDPQQCSDTEVSGTLSLQALSGSTLDSVTIYAMVQAPATGVSNETAHAYSDPYIYIDPAFANASSYSIVVSQGAGNVPVPEPALLWLVGSAFVAVGLRRR